MFASVSSEGMKFRAAPWAARPATVAAGLNEAAGSAKSVLPPAAATFAFTRFAQLHGPVDQRLETGGVEVHVRQRREDRLEREEVGRLVDDAALPALGGEERQALHRVHQQVLQVGDLAALAAHPDLLAPEPLDRLFALVTKHRPSPWLVELVRATLMSSIMQGSYTPEPQPLL